MHSFRSFALIILIASFALILLPACGDDTSDNTLPADGDTITDGDVDEESLEESEEADSPTESGEDEEAPIVQEPFRFLVISDTHVRLPDMPDDEHYNNQKNLDNLVGVIELINNDYSDAAFVAVTGDLVGTLFSDDVNDYGTDEPNPAETFKSMMDGLSMPYYAVLGNHDYQIGYDLEIDEGISAFDYEGIEAVWNQVLGIDPYYAFTLNGVKMLFLNANRGEARYDVCTGSTAEAFCTGSFDEEQLQWIESELATAIPTFIFLHHPLITDNNSEKLFSMAGESFQVHAESPLYDILEEHKESVRAVFVGHGHIWEHDTLFETIEVYETGSTGDTLGKPNNIHIVDVLPAVDDFSVSKSNENARYGVPMKK